MSEPQQTARILGLLRLAIVERRRARLCWEEARTHLAAARLAAGQGESEHRRAHLAMALRARAQAQKCIAFARICDGRAHRLAEALPAAANRVS